MNIAIAAVYAKDWIAVARSDRPKLTQAELSRVLRSGVTALDIRIESLGRGPSRHEAALAAAAHEAGVEVRCHSWTGLVDRKTGVSIADMSVGLIQLRHGIQAPWAAPKWSALRWLA